MKKVIAILLLFGSASSFFCSSICTDSNISCSASPYDPFNCSSCAASFYTSSNCLTRNGNPVISIRAKDMTISNQFFSSSSSNFSCPVTYNITSTTTITITYNFSGKYVSNDYIYKNFTDLTPHYQIIIRFSIAFIGVWSQYDYLKLDYNDTLSASYITFSYNCYLNNYTQSICNISRPGNHVDCIGIYQYNISHNTTSLLLNYSSLTNQRDPLVQFWSLFDLNIQLLPCHSTCLTCYGPYSNQCFTCANSYYLNGNSCGSCGAGSFILPVTPNNTNTGTCVSMCPQGYFVNATLCTPCAANCLSCFNSITCLVQSVSTPQSLLYNKLVLWIILIILAALFLFALIYRILCGKSQSRESPKQTIQQNETRTNEQKLTITEQKLNNQNNVHIQQIDFNDHVRADNPRKRKRQEKDMNRSNNRF